MRHSTPVAPDDSTVPPVVNSTDSAANTTTPKNITHRTLHGLFWTFSGSSVQMALRIVVLIALARLLKPADFGLVTAALVVTGFSELFSQLGIGPAIVQRPQLEERHIRTGFTISAILGFLLLGIFYFLAPIIAAFYHMQNQNLTPILRALALVFPISGLSVVSYSLLSRDLEFKRIAGIQVTAYLVGYVGMGIGLAWCGFGPWALVAASLTQELGNTIGRLIFKPHSKKLLFDLEAAKELMLLGGGFTAARMGNYLATQGDNLIVGRYLGLAQLGLYSRSYQLIVIPATLLGQVLQDVLFPVMARFQDDKVRLAQAYKRGLALIALLVLPMSVAMTIVAPEFIYTLFGPQWKGAIEPFGILTIGVLFRTSYKMSDSIARSAGAVYKRAWRQWIYAGCVLSFAGVGQHWGLNGVAIGVVGALVVNFVLMADLGIRITGLTWADFLGAHIPALTLAVVAGLESWAIAEVLRAMVMPSVVILLTTLVVPAVTMMALAYFMPKITLGEEGLWIVDALTRQLSGRLNGKSKSQRAKERVA